jgi:hypothetical protein
MNGLPSISDFNFDPTYLLLGLIPGAIGMVLLALGRKQQRTSFLVAGGLFLLYPWLTETTWGLVVGAVVIGLGLWMAVRMGW